MKRPTRLICLLVLLFGLAALPRSAAAQVFVEHDQFSPVCAQLTLTQPVGISEALTATGSLSIDVFFVGSEGGATDTDGDGLEQVPIRIVDLYLTGTSPSLGPFTIGLAGSPDSSGEIEETINNTPFLLDVPPFAVSGQADQDFDLFFELQVGATTLHNDAPRHFVATIDHKPPASAAFASAGAGTALLDAAGKPTGLAVTSFQFGCGGSQSLGFVLSCFYDCKEGPDSRRWREITTLMVANPTGRTIEVGLAFLDGNERFVAQSSLDLSSEDLDEVNVCRSLEAAGVDVPSAGLVELLVMDRAAVVGTVHAWIKNLLGRFSKGTDEPFRGVVHGIAKTQCEAVPPGATSVDQLLARIAREQPPVIQPVLIDGTGDDQRPSPTDYPHDHSWRSERHSR
jgi:hypothetical protein